MHVGGPLGGAQEGAGLEPLSRQGEVTEEQCVHAGTGGQCGDGEQNGQCRGVPEGLGLQGAQHGAGVDHDADAEEASQAQAELGKALIGDARQEVEPGDLPNEEEGCEDAGENQHHGAPLDDGGLSDEGSLEHDRLSQLVNQQGNADADDDDGPKQDPDQGTGGHKGRLQEQADDGCKAQHTATEAAQIQVGCKFPTPKLLH